MQIDMHYHGTYAMARAAGLGRETAKVVATSAQFVDDNTARGQATFRDGARIDTEATAHHPFNLSNRKEHDQRRVWVPFHFIPGNIGATYTERLKCRMDSAIVQEMRDHHLTCADRAFAPHLLGIAAHVYADTFSHYGFSGVSSRGNKVDNDSFRFHEEVEGTDSSAPALSPEMKSYVTRKANVFFKKRRAHGGLLPNINKDLHSSWWKRLFSIKSLFVEEVSGALGHGSVATLPDRPYLVWCFDYERPDEVAGMRSTRNNPVTFLAGCRALHDMFRRFARLRPDSTDGDGRDFEAIAPRVQEILLTQADKAGRIEAWQEAARSGAVFGEAGETIPGYEGERWNAQRESLDGGEDCRTALDMPVWRFYQAAALHRTYVLRDLLPKHGLIVD